MTEREDVKNDGYLTERIQQMQTDELVPLLSHENFLVRTSTIMEIVERGETNAEIESGLMKAAEDETSFWNTFLVKDLATAALDRLGIQKYYGDRHEVLCLKKADFAAHK